MIYLVEARVGDRAEVRDQQMNVNGRAPAGHVTQSSECERAARERQTWRRPAPAYARPAVSRQFAGIGYDFRPIRRYRGLTALIYTSSRKQSYGYYTLCIVTRYQAIRQVAHRSQWGLGNLHACWRARNTTDRMTFLWSNEQYRCTEGTRWKLWLLYCWLLIGNC